MVKTKVMVIDHLCIAVKSLKSGIKHWISVYGYHQMTKIITNTRQKVKVVFLQKDNSLTIKLIEPTNKSSPIYSFANRGGGIHHICFKIENIQEGIKHLKDSGVKLLVPPQPGEAFKNEEIAFLLDEFGVNIELIDTDKRAGLIDIDP